MKLSLLLYSSPVGYPQYYIMFVCDFEVTQTCRSFADFRVFFYLVLDHFCGSSRSGLIICGEGGMEVKLKKYIRIIMKLRARYNHSTNNVCGIYDS